MNTNLTKNQVAPTRILLLGGYGNFGKRLGALLLGLENVQVIIGGRHLERAEALKQKWEKEFNNISPISVIVLDRNDDSFAEQLKNANIQILVHLAGPFQGQDYKVAKACIDNNIHYVDIADARKYVSCIGELDKSAKKQEVIIVSGASSVPGLSTAVVDKFALNFSTLRLIEMGIAPGNRVERGVGTLASVFQYVGKPFERLDNGSWSTAYGWQDSHKAYFGDNVGLRWQASCDVPDLELLPQRYKHLSTVKFYAGLEVGFLHLMLWKLSWLVRIGLIPNLSSFAKVIEKTSHLFDSLGTEVGGMHVHLYGTDLNYQPLDMNWHLVAESGHGLNIPILPAYIVIQKIINEELTVGARPCVSLFTLEEFDRAAENFNIYHTLEERHM